MMHEEVRSFGDDLDELLEKWAAKPHEDRPSVAEIVGCLHFRATTLCMTAAEQGEGEP